MIRKWSDINNSLAPQISNMKLTSSASRSFAMPSSRRSQLSWVGLLAVRAMSVCVCCVVVVSVSSPLSDDFFALSCWHSGNLNRMLHTRWLELMLALAHKPKAHKHFCSLVARCLVYMPLRKRSAIKLILECVCDYFPLLHHQCCRCWWFFSALVQRYKCGVQCLVPVV